MAFRTLFILVFTPLAAVPALANPYAQCPGAFEQMYSSEIAQTARQIPELAFLPVEKTRQIQQAENAVLSTHLRRETSYKIIPQLRETVDYLQAERRARFRRLESLRDLRRQERAKILGGAEGDSAIRQSKRAKKDIDGQIQGLQRELTALTGHLVPLRNQLGRVTIEAAATATAAETGMLILLRNTLINAAGQLAHKGVGKGLAVKFHSASEGVIAGLIPYQQRLSSKVAAKGPAEIAKRQKLVDEALAKGQVVKTKFRVGTLVAVERGGQVKFVDIAFEHVEESEIVDVIAVFDAEWQPRLLTSDVDPLAFGRRSELLPEIPYSSKEKGIITPSEREAIRTYNRQASKILGKDAGTFMAHGAENRNPISGGISGYPITAHFPDGRMKVIEEGPASDPDLHLKAFFREAEREGFHLDVNPLWGWPDDLDALFQHGNAKN